MVTNVSFALDQYLKIATGGNVIAERGIVQDRWRLFCKVCYATITYPSGINIADDYVNKGILDNNIQEFVKEHAHLKPTFDVSSKTVTYAPTNDLVQKVDLKTGKQLFEPLKASIEKWKNAKIQELAIQDKYTKIFKDYQTWAAKEAAEKMWYKEEKKEEPKPAPLPPKKEGRRFR